MQAACHDLATAPASATHCWVPFRCVRNSSSPAPTPHLWCPQNLTPITSIRVFSIPLALLIFLSFVFPDSPNLGSSTVSSLKPRAEFHVGLSNVVGASREESKFGAVSCTRTGGEIAGQEKRKWWLILGIGSNLLCVVFRPRRHFIWETGQPHSYSPAFSMKITHLLPDTLLIPNLGVAQWPTWGKGDQFCFSIQLYTKEFDNLDEMDKFLGREIMKAYSRINVNPRFVSIIHSRNRLAI